MTNKSFYLFALPLALMTASAVSAQDTKKEKREIIIRDGVDSTQKMIVEVHGDKVYLNGKEVNGDEKKNLVIKKQKVPGSEKVTVEVHTIEGPSPKSAITINGETIVIDDNKSVDDKATKNIVKRKIIRDGKVIEDSEVNMGNPENLHGKILLDNNLTALVPQMHIAGGTLGVQIAPAEKAEGAMVVDVVPGSAAEKAGLKKGDVITAVDDKKIAGPNELSQIIRVHKPNEEVSIAYQRDGKSGSVKAKLDAPKRQMNIEQFESPIELGNPKVFDQFITREDFPRSFDVKGLKMPKPKLGFQIEDTEDGVGVKVLDVIPDLPASKSGLKKDDLIVSIAGEKITNVDQAKNLLKDIQGASKLQVKRGTQLLNIELKVPKPLKRASL